MNRRSTSGRIEVGYLETYGWRRSVVVSALASINVVYRHWDRLVVGWVTVCWPLACKPCRPNNSLRSTQLSIPPGQVNRVPACLAEVKAGCVYLRRMARSTV